MPPLHRIPLSLGCYPQNHFLILNQVNVVMVTTHMRQIRAQNLVVGSLARSFTKGT